MSMRTFLVAAVGLAVSVAAFAENNILALPGQAEGTAVGAAETNAARATHASLRHPFIELYHLEPTVTAGRTAKVAYYVTDFDHAKVRFGDDSARFDVTLGWSADGTNWTEKVQKGVRTGDGAFSLEGLPRGDYTIRLSCVDGKGVESRTLWNDFIVRTAEELAITESQTARPTLADLAKLGVEPEPEDFYRFVPVEVPEGVEFPVGIRAENTLKRPDHAEKRRAVYGAISNAVDAAIAGEEGRKAVAAHAKGYVVFAPARNGAFIYRAREWRRIVPGAAFDADATERRAATNSVALTRYLAAEAAAGRRKVVLPKAVWRISCKGRLIVPGGLTLDLNGGKLKINGAKVVSATPILLYRAQDAHLVNGRVEGVYFEYDYERSKTRNPEHVRCISLYGDARRCSFENLDISFCVGSGTTFGAAWLEKVDDVVAREVLEWTKRNAVISFAAQPGRGRGAKRTPDEHWEKGRLDAQGAVRDGGEGCWTSPSRPVGALARQNRFFSISRFLGYGGMSGVSDYFTIAFYGAGGRFLHRETGFQYHRILIPSGAETMRISLEAVSREIVDKSDLKAFFLYRPEHCAWRNVRYRHCRTNGLSIHNGFGMLFEDIDISRSGDESCRCASDAEDGWDDMQNMTFRRVTCHDNPNGDFTVCCGHSFVYENCSMRWWMWQRVHSPLVRNCTVKGGEWDCLTRTRNGYTRFENNVYDCRAIRLGTQADVAVRKKVTPDWEIVLDGGTFRGADTNAPMRVSAELTGRFRNCTFENCQLVGPEKRFTDCTLGAGCTRAAK